MQIAKVSSVNWKSDSWKESLSLLFTSAFGQHFKWKCAKIKKACIIQDRTHFSYIFVQSHKELSLNTWQSTATALQEETLPIEKKEGISYTDDGEKETQRIYFWKVY